MHDGECRKPQGQRNPKCFFCECESSWDAGDGVWTCWACGREIIHSFSLVPCYRRASDGRCDTHCPEID